MSLDNNSIVFAIFLGLVIVLVVWIVRLELRIKRMLRGQSGGSLEDAIVALTKNVKETDQVNEAIREHLLKMEERLRNSIQHVKTVRFNPFREQGQGSNQSFAAAFLDEHGNGTVISTLYARDKVGVYAKPILNYESEHELSEEEQSVLKH